MPNTVTLSFKKNDFSNQDSDDRNDEFSAQHHPSVRHDFRKAPLDAGLEFGMSEFLPFGITTILATDCVAVTVALALVLRDRQITGGSYRCF